MKLFLVISLILIISGGINFAQSNISIIDEKLIKGNRISEITEWNHAIRENKPVETGTISMRTRYDKNGHIQEETTFNSKGEESRKVTSRIDERGNRIEYRVFDSRNNRLTYSQISNFDQQGNKLLESGFDGLGNYRNVYQLMADGRVREIHYSTNGSLREKRVFTYTGNETTISVRLPDNTEVQKIILLSDDNEHLLKEAYYDEKGNLTRKTEYTYNLLGQLAGEQRYHGSQLLYHNTYVYDGDLLQKIIRTDNRENDVVINRYEYNGNNQLISEAWYNENVADYSTKQFSWNDQGKMTSVTCYYASYQLRVMYRYDYSFY